MQYIKLEMGDKFICFSYEESILNQFNSSIDFLYNEYISNHIDDEEGLGRLTFARKTVNDFILITREDFKNICIGQIAYAHVQVNQPDGYSLYGRIHPMTLIFQEV